MKYLLAITFTLFNLVEMLNQCNPVTAAKCGMHLIYNTEEEEGDEDPVLVIDTKYGNDDMAFRMQLDTSTQAFLYFNNEDDAREWLKAAALTEPFDYEGKTFYAHRKDGDLNLYLETPWGDDGGFETRYVIYPPQPEGDQYCLAIEVYV